MGPGWSCPPPGASEPIPTSHPFGKVGIRLTQDPGTQRMTALEGSSWRSQACIHRPGVQCGGVPQMGQSRNLLKGKVGVFASAGIPGTRLGVRTRWPLGVV
jgi:hypothetical protein